MSDSSRSRTGSARTLNALARSLASSASSAPASTCAQQPSIARPSAVDALAFMTLLNALTCVDRLPGGCHVSSWHSVDDDVGIAIRRANTEIAHRFGAAANTLPASRMVLAAGGRGGTATLYKRTSQ